MQYKCYKSVLYTVEKLIATARTAGFTSIDLIIVPLLVIYGDLISCLLYTPLSVCIYAQAIGSIAYIVESS